MGDGRSILIIVWQLLFDPVAQFHDLGADFYDTRLGTERAKRNHVQHLEALGYTVTLEPKVATPQRPQSQAFPAPPGAVACPLTFDPVSSSGRQGENCHFLSPVVKQNRVVQGHQLTVLLLTKVAHGFSRIRRRTFSGSWVAW